MNDTAILTDGGLCKFPVVGQYPRVESCENTTQMDVELWIKFKILYSYDIGPQTEE